MFWLQNGLLNKYPWKVNGFLQLFKDSDKEKKYIWVNLTSSD